MNAIHLHLILNHFPITCTGLALILAFVGLSRRDKSLQLAAMVFLVMAAIVAFIVTNSGHQAEHMVEKLIPVDHHAIHEHEEVAQNGFYMAIVVGIMALVAWIIGRKDIQRARMLVIIATISSLASGVTMGYAGLLGGFIAHKELKPETLNKLEQPLPAGTGDNAQDDEEHEERD